MKFEGREFSDQELQSIKYIIAHHFQEGRSAISRLICEQFNWRKTDGNIKDLSCRLALLKMEKQDLIKLPARQRVGRDGRLTKKRTLFGQRQPDKDLNLSNLDLAVGPLGDKFEKNLWNELIDRYHYLGHTPLPGAQMKYFARNGNEILAALSFSAGAWMTKPRDQFIGWDHETRQRNLHLVVNNSRFLILPWIHCPNLATKTLSLVIKRIVNDFEQRYRYRPLLLETFVEKDRFAGTCYKAGNWIHVGQTTGRGKLGAHDKKDKVIKDIWLYPLKKTFRAGLCQSN